MIALLDFAFLDFNLVNFLMLSTKKTIIFIFYPKGYDALETSLMRKNYTLNKTLLTKVANFRKRIILLSSNKRYNKVTKTV